MQELKEKNTSAKYIIPIKNKHFILQNSVLDKAIKISK